MRKHINFESLISESFDWDEFESQLAAAVADEIDYCELASEVVCNWREEIQSAASAVVNNEVDFD